MKKREMYYYCQNGENFEKWLISFDEEKLAELREKVLDKCSYITHEEKDVYYTNPDMMNYREGCVRNVETRVNDGYSKHYSFDLYHPKLLVDIIDALLKGKPSAIDDLENPRPTEEKFDFEKVLAAKSSEIDAIPNADTERKMEALREYQKIKSEAKLNENQVSALNYYPLVQSLITREFVANIQIEEILKITNFFAKNVNILGLCLDIKDKNNLKLYLKPNV